MRTLFKEYGNAIIVFICVSFILLFCFAPIFAYADENGETKYATPLEYISRSSSEQIDNVDVEDDDFKEYAKRGKPTIEIVEIRLHEKTPVNLHEIFISKDNEGNELDEEFMKVINSDGQEVEVFNDEGLAVFPLADNYTVTVKAIDSARMETVKQFVLVVDYVPDNYELEEVEFADYTVNHYRRIATHDENPIINYENATGAEWELIETNARKAKLGKSVLIQPNTYAGLYLTEDVRETIDGGEVIDLYYNPKMCELHITDNLGRNDYIEVMAGTKFSINRLAIEEMYLPVVTVGDKPYTEGTITITEEMLEKTININLDYLSYGEISGYHGIYDKKPHGITVVPTLTDSDIFYSTDGANWSRDNIFRTNVGTQKVYYKIVNPKREDAIGYEYIEIEKENAEIIVDSDYSDKELSGSGHNYSGATCIGCDFTPLVKCITDFDVSVADGSVLSADMRDYYGDKQLVITPKRAGATTITLAIRDTENYAPYEVKINVTFNPHETYHQHVKTVSQVSCTSSQIERYRCTECGRQVDITTQGAWGHAYGGGGSVTQWTSCVNNGYRHYKCTRCGVNLPETYLYEYAWGHNWGNNGPVTQYTSCTQNGVRYHTCTRCGAWGSTFIYEYAWGHNWAGDGNITQYANCAQGGYRNHRCTRCGAQGTNYCYEGAWGHAWLNDMGPNDPSLANRRDYFEDKTYNNHLFGDRDGSTWFKCTRPNCEGQTCVHSCDYVGYHTAFGTDYYNIYYFQCTKCGLWCNDYPSYNHDTIKTTP